MKIYLNGCTIKVTNLIEGFLVVWKHSYLYLPNARIAKLGRLNRYLQQSILMLSGCVAPAVRFSTHCFAHFHI